MPASHIGQTTCLMFMRSQNILPFHMFTSDRVRLIAFGFAVFLLFIIFLSYRYVSRACDDCILEFIVYVKSGFLGL